MLEELYTFYLPKKTHPWCYISLEIDPRNIDVNVHPTKHEVKFLHENSIIEKMKLALDEKLSANSASRTFYLKTRLPKTDITKEVLKEILPEYEEDNSNKIKKIRPQEMIRTDASDQKLDKFNFMIHKEMKYIKNDDNIQTHLNMKIQNSIEENTDEENIECLTSDTINIQQKDKSAHVVDNKKNTDKIQTSDIINIQQKNKSAHVDNVDNEKNTDKIQKPPNIIDMQQKDKSMHIITTAATEKSNSPWSNIINDPSPSTSDLLASDESNINLCIQNINKEEEEKLNTMQDILEITNDEIDEDTADSIKDKCIDVIADKARKQVYKCFGNKNTKSEEKKIIDKNDIDKQEIKNYEPEENKQLNEIQNVEQTSKEINNDNDKNNDNKCSYEFKSYSINNFRREVKLTSVLKLRKEVEDACHEGVKQILSELTFVGCIDQSSALIQSGVNLYLCNTQKLA